MEFYMFKLLKKIVFIFCIVASDCSIASHQTPDLTDEETTILCQKSFRTAEEKEVLFKALGVQYTKRVIPHELMKSSLYDQCFYNVFKLSWRNARAMKKYASFATKIERNYIAPISIQWINSDIGFGAFAQTNLQTGEFVGEYTGKIKDNSSIEDHRYAWGIWMGRTQGEDEFLVDALHHGNELRFVNDDGYKSNCQSAPIIGKDGIIHVIYKTRRAIQAGEQLTINYGEDYWEGSTQTRIL